MNFDEALRGLRARVLGMLGRGVLEHVDDTGKRARLQVRGLDGRVRIFERFTPYGLASKAPQGAEVLYGYLGSHQTHGAVVGTQHLASEPKNLEDGETGLYHADGQRLRLLSGGKIELEADEIALRVGPSEILITASGITITAPLIDLERSV